MVGRALQRCRHDCPAGLVSPGARVTWLLLLGCKAVAQDAALSASRSAVCSQTVQLQKATRQETRTPARAVDVAIMLCRALAPCFIALQFLRAVLSV
jgi:hypothetical protein